MPSSDDKRAKALKARRRLQSKRLALLQRDPSARPRLRGAEGEPISKTHPEKAQFWHPTRNKPFTPDDVTYGSQNFFWWRCTAEPAHEFYLTVGAFCSRTYDCPICLKKMPKPGQSLIEQYPLIAQEWHPSANGWLRPEYFAWNSNRNVVWQCRRSKLHSWKCSIKIRTQTDQGCPNCDKEEIKSKKSLADRYPALASEWSTHNSFTPSDVMEQSDLVVAWTCKIGHNFEGKISNRVQGKGQCPQCTNVKHNVSLAALSPEIAAEWDKRKNKRLTPEDVSSGSSRLVYWRCRQGHSWRAKIQSRTHSGNGCPFCGRRLLSALHNLQVDRPETAAEWHPTKNGKLTPKDVLQTSELEVWWQCAAAKDHQWKQAVVQRTRAGCPFCAGKMVSRTNSLAANYPGLAKEWHPTKNGLLTPESITSKSGKAVWWQCATFKEHAWSATISSRAGAGSGCPECVRWLSDKKESLAKLYPALAKEWHPTKNGALLPSHVRASSIKRVWWQCRVHPSHCFDIEVVERAIKGRPCPFCSNDRVSVTNSLATTHRAIARQWHPVKNGSLRAKDVVAGHSKRVWWKCGAGPDHEWQATPHARTGSGTGCPCCCGRKLVKSNSLAALFPAIAREWHPTKNGTRRASGVIPGANEKVWWQCGVAADHNWQASIKMRTRHGIGCPYCSGRLASKTTSLAAKRQDLAKEWHPTKNGDLRPDDVTLHSYKKAWWSCSRDQSHEWQSEIRHRVRHSKCPFCASQEVRSS